MRTENAEMRVIKWKRAQNDDRKKENGENERERERAINDTCCDCELSPWWVELLASSMRTHNQSLSLGTVF